MYDTINLWLSSEQAGIKDLPAYTSQFLTNLTEHQKEDGQVYLTGRLGANYRASISSSGVSLKGSLAKYFLSDNFHTLTRSDSERALEMMADELHLPIDLAKVTRIDFAQNFIMNYTPELYYGYLGECRYYKRLSQPKSLYYSNGLRTKLFYNKVAEGIKQGLKLPDVWSEQNVLRYEMRYTSRLNKEFALPDLNASYLYDEKFYIQLVQRWVNEYESIHKLHTIHLDLTKMSSPKDFFRQLILIKANEIGQANLMQMVDELKAMNVFDKPEYYSRLRRDIRDLYKHPELTKKSDMISELDKKVNFVKRHYR